MLKKNDNITYDVEKISIENPLPAKEFNDFHDKLDVEKYGETKRKLNLRHVNLLMIGQSIGSALFVSIKNPLHNSGSLSFFSICNLACLVIYPLMQAIGEMCSYLPIKGSFFSFFCSLC